MRQWAKKGRTPRRGRNVTAVTPPRASYHCGGRPGEGDWAQKGGHMPHVLYNHITQSWDLPELDDGGGDIAREREQAPELSPAGQRLVSRLALGAATAIAGLILWGLGAGLLLGVS